MLAYVYVAIVAILASILSCVAIDCPKLKPDGSVPPCSVCVSCNVPQNASLVSLYRSDQSLPNGAVRYKNVLDGSDPYLITVTPKDGGITVRLEVSGSAPDTFRVIEIARQSHIDTYPYWISGNNQGNGVVCEATLPWRKEELDGAQFVKFWDHVPADKCF